MEDQDSNSSQYDTISENSKSSTLQVFEQFQELYNKQLKTTDESPEGLKLKVKILQSWVHDLTDQNVMLVKTVGELEEEALKRLSSIEANIQQKDEAPKSLSSTDMLTSRGMSQVELLCGQLKAVKQQLSDKESLVAKYQSRIEQLRASIEKDKAENDKQYIHRYSMTESTMDPHLAELNQAQSYARKELKSTQKQLSHMENEVSELKKKLKEADVNVMRLRSDLVGSEKNAREMRSALTAEVAEKHDQILAFRRELGQLEEQLRQADMQTHFKDDIIKELRKEVKVARSKETLVEVLGIKERSLTHLEQLTEQLEQKERIISCLQSQLQSTADPGNTLYRIRQQVDWFMENVTQQCNQTNVPEEFKKCITTMLEDLRESIECCNFGPSTPAEPCKDSIHLISALQKSFDQSKKGLCQSWSMIFQTAHQVNKVELSQHVGLWKRCLVKQQCLQLKIQELIKATIDVLSSSKCSAGSMMDPINSLHHKLDWVEVELSGHRNHKRGAALWIENLYCQITDSVKKIEEITKVAKAVRRGEEGVLAELDCRIQAMDCLVSELSEAINIELKACEKLHHVEKSQRIKLDTLLASVLHHHELYTQQMSVSDDMKKEILRLLSNLKHNINKDFRKPPKPPRCDKKICPTQAELENFQLKGLGNRNNKQIFNGYEEIQRVTDTQDETIQILQNSLKMCQKEAEDLHQKVISLESKNSGNEHEYKKQIQDYQKKITELQCNLKQSEDAARKHQKSEAALQLVIANLKENIGKDHKKIGELLKENGKLQEEFSNISANFKEELENHSLKVANSNQEKQLKVDELKKQAKSWAMKVDDIEAQMKTIEEKLCSSADREKELEHELRAKESQFKEELSEKQKEVNRLSNVIKSMTDKLKETTASKEAERTKRCEAEQKLQSVCAVCEKMESKVLEKESAVEKLQSALTQLSNKFVSRRMDNKDCVRHYQEECAKFEALYNTTVCKLHSKEDEVSSLMREVDRLKNELDGHILAPIHERDEEESCPFLLGRVQQLSKELQMAQSYRSSYESLLKELTEKCTKKEEEAAHLRAQLKQVTLQRDKLLADLERAQQEIIKLKIDNSDLNSLIKKMEIGKAQLTEQMKTMKRLLCDSQVAVQSGGHTHSVNIEVQREISGALSSQLRGVKQKLHSTRHDFKSLQSAYEELKEKYSLLQKGERDLNHGLETKHLHCTPCGTKSSKSLAHIGYSEELDKAPTMKYTHSKSWHQMEASYDPGRREKRWKQKLREVMQEDFVSEAMNHSSSSN